MNGWNLECDAEMHLVKTMHRVSSDCAVEPMTSLAYDRFGRLVETSAGFGAKVTYAYDAKGRLACQTVDGSPIEYVYTKYGQLAGKYLGGRLCADAAVEYEYSKNGRIVARTANGVRQTFEYDRKGQLLAVKDADGSDVERYAYDKAGNMVRKMVGGITTTFTFDAANQLVSSTTDGVTTRYAYDAAGRLVREGDKTYTYGYLDKVMAVNDGANTYTYAYHPDGQLASANYGARNESFSWDGLVLIRRGDEHFINEPHVGGGNPVASSKGMTYFNDLLGTTVGAKSGATYTAAALSAFGEDLNHHSPTPTSNSHSFYTGKPEVAGLGHAFLMRNYRASLGKWQTADPMGYPDGWNQLAYCGNGVTGSVDLWGCLTVRCVSGGRDVRSSTDISVYKTSEDTNEGGVFDVHVQDISGIGGDITITLTLSIFMDECLLKNEAFVAGMLSEYAPHEGVNDNSMGRSSVYEAILAHELAHAEYYLDHQKTLFVSLLRMSNIDNGTWTYTQICDLVKRAFDVSWTYGRAESNEAANNATINWFDSHSEWMRVSPVGGMQRWERE